MALSLFTILQLIACARIDFKFVLPKRSSNERVFEMKFLVKTSVDDLIMKRVY